MIYDFLNNQIDVSVDKIDIFESNIRFKLDFIEELFLVSIKDWPNKQKNTMHFQVDYGESISPVARAFPGGLYRIVFPVRIVYELDNFVFGLDVKKHE